MRTSRPPAASGNPSDVPSPPLRSRLQGGHVATVRDSRGDDQMAACGQLGSLDGGTRRAPLLRPPEALAGALTGAAS